MSSNHESGHSKNAANFEHLISVITTFGTAYTPPRTELTTTAIAVTNTGAQSVLTGVKNFYTEWKNTTNAREIAFKALRPLLTRLYNTLLACGANEQTLNDFKSINRKVQGSSTKKNNGSLPIDPIDNGPSGNADNVAKIIESTEDVSKTVSTSQRSFDNLIEHFDKSIKLLASVTAFTPNETDLKIAALTTQLANLRTLNSGAVTAYNKLTTARIARNHFFYDEPTGLLSIARSIKGYIKGHFGASSPEYLQVSKIKFVRIVKGK